MMKAKKIFLAAAGSGGHILPALVLGQQWLNQNSGGQVYFFTSSRTLDQRLVTQSSLVHQTVVMKVDTFSIKKWWKLPIVLLQLLYSFFTSLWHILRHRPDKIICTGGLIGIPLCITGRLAGVKVELYELNAVPGKAVKALMPFAHTIFTPFTQAAQHCHFLGKNFVHKSTQVPYPLRFSNTHEKIDKQNVFDAINQVIERQFFSADKKTIVLVGGSQGSVFLNTTFQKVLEQDRLLAQSLQIIHQTGAHDLAFYKAWYHDHNITAYVFDFDPNINRYYQIADLVICRAGAGTLFELAHFEKKSIVIPLITSTTTHQKDNALAISIQYPELFTVLDQQLLQGNPALLGQELQVHLQH